jgi:hypothetical protein
VLCNSSCTASTNVKKTVKIPFLLQIEGAKLEAGEKVLRSRKTVLKAVSQAALSAAPLTVSLTAIRHCINTVNPRPRERVSRRIIARNSFGGFLFYSLWQIFVEG